MTQRHNTFNPGVVSDTSKHRSKGSKVNMISKPNRYKCPNNRYHYNPKKYAKKHRYMCRECGAELTVREHKLNELKRLASDLGYEVWPINKEDEQ